ncbi:MAG: hypothetical protein ACLGI7_17595, partial [Gammaproteobacteria bacterium]
MIEAKLSGRIRPGTRTRALAFVIALGLSASAAAWAQSPPAARLPLVDIIGAVRNVDSLRLAPGGATLDEALAHAGGVSANGYRFAAMVLRPRSAVPTAPPRVEGCVPLQVLHVSLLLRDDPVLSAYTMLVDEARDGRRVRVDARAAPQAGLGSDRVAVPLHVGDAVAVPQRSAHVYVAAPGGQAVSLRHEPLATADDYLERAALDDADVSD